MRSLCRKNELQRVVALPSFAEGHGCKPVDECEVGTRRSLGEGGCASAFAVRSRLRPTKVGGFRPTKCVERCHGRKAVGLHIQTPPRHLIGRGILETN
jgi:hypothetical protein